MGTRGTAFQLLYQKLRHIAKMQGAIAEYRWVRQEFELCLILNEDNAEITLRGDSHICTEELIPFSLNKIVQLT